MPDPKRRYSDRPTEDGGPFIWLATMMFAFFGGGAGTVLAVHYFIAQKIGKGYLFVGATVLDPVNIPVFLFGAITTTWLAVKLWREASQ